MTEHITQVFEHQDFAIWHVPQANGYVYEAAGIMVDEHSYADCPFEATFDDALNAACELYDVEVGSLSQPLPVVYSNTVFQIFRTPAGEFLHLFRDDPSAQAPTDRNIADLPGPRHPTRDAAVIAAFEEDLARRGG